MFFSLDPKAFRNPKTCSLQNGTTIYSNRTIPEDCSCVAPFPADSGFAGPGVIAAFCFLSVLTIFIAAVPAFYSIRHSWRLSSRPHRFWVFLVDVLQLRGSGRALHHPSPESSDLRIPSTVLPTETRPQPPERRVVSSDSEKTFESKTKRIEPHPPDPYLVALAKFFLMSLTDIQIITGLAYILTGLVRIKQISFYHEQFVINLWWLTVNSLWVSRIDYSDHETLSQLNIVITDRRSSRWRLRIRGLAVIISVILSAVFQAVVTVREHIHWNATKTGKCYAGAGLGSGYGDNIFWLLGTCLYAFALILGLWSRTSRWYDTQLLDRIDPALTALWDRAEESLRELHDQQKFKDSSLIGGLLTKIWLVIKFVGRCVVLFALWCLIQFLAIWSSGVGSYAVEMIVYSAFALMSIVWVIYLKIENKALVLGNENVWGFAQMLPLALLLLVGFWTLDRIQDIPRKKPRTDEVP